MVIDLGHGGSDLGAVSSELKENHVVWRIACMVTDILICQLY
ncbi:N-acetylmuramoyl-L-alanine amidase [Alkaliphilus sp. MSJ-5]|uniref:N-acetylmuramoyl-L-alanine amidase n=1 Tax=Alkaliphilus flagellatus TaxID=2841507 RepID=A0ABS6FXX4_9FIRM|nr:N-acetylmuramoyl-L-alanine amidase [Alkaliphilus flagellatus]